MLRSNASNMHVVRQPHQILIRRAHALRTLGEFDASKSSEFAMSTSSDIATDGAAPAAIGIDIGGTKVLGVAINAAGDVVGEHRVPSAVREGGVEGAIRDVYEYLAYHERVSEVEAVGVGIAGLVDFEGRMRFGPNLPDVLALPVRASMEAATGLPVSVDNDANAAGYGELVLGAAQGARNALMVTLGTGIGGAIIINGDVFRGANGFAGEIGHFTVDRNGPLCACGELGHWEAIASGNALGVMGAIAVDAREAPEIGALARADGGVVTGHHVAQAARDGSVGALAIIDEFADNVALGLAGLANIFDPELIVIAGGLVELGELLFAPLRLAFAQHLEGLAHRPQIRLVPAQLGERAGAIGAAALARSERARQRSSGRVS